MKERHHVESAIFFCEREGSAQIGCGSHQVAVAERDDLGPSGRPGGVEDEPCVFRPGQPRLRGVTEDRDSWKQRALGLPHGVEEGRADVVSVVDAEQGVEIDKEEVRVLDAEESTRVVVEARGERSRGRSDSKLL